METVKLVIYVPETHADVVRDAMGKAGAGQVGDYKHCTFSVKGVGRYIPLDTAHPYIGTPGKLEKVIKAIKEVHPYEEIALDVYPLVLNPHKTTYK